MGPALERLLASPSALGLLRRLVRHDGTFATPFSAPCRATSACLRRPSPATSVACCSKRSTATLSRHPLVNCRRRLKRNAERKHSIPEPAVTKRPVFEASPLPSVPLDDKHMSHASYLWVLISYYAGMTLPTGHPFDNMLYEADVTGPLTPDCPRLVDRADHKNDMDLWLELLHFRKRLHGFDGVRDIWSAMMQRNLQLPVNGSTADALWSVFIDAAIADRQLMDEVYEHAKHLWHHCAQQRSSTYRDIVGGLLRAHPRSALSWHHRMRSDGMVPSDAAAVVLRHALHSSHANTAFREYRSIYVGTFASGIYDLCMSEVCDSSSFTIASKWHHFFVTHGDYPSPEMLSRPLIRRLSAYTDTPSEKMKPRVLSSFKRLTRSDVSPTPDRAASSQSLDETTSLSENAHTIKQRNIGDAFCARLFATGAFSVDLVTTGLRMLGLETLGSLALREIAARAQDPWDYLCTLQSLEASGIKIADSAFSRSLKRFAEDGNSDYFDVIVSSDQHPDMYDDAAVQKRLLASFLAAGKLSEAHATLAILTMSESDPESHTWNLLLQTYCKTSDNDHLLQILHEMRLKAITLHRQSLNAIYSRFIRRDRKDMYTKRAALNLDFISSIFLDILRNGQELDTKSWKEILRRYGMTNRLLTLERLLLWLVAMYSTFPKRPSASVSAPQYLMKPAFSGVTSTATQTYTKHMLLPLRELFSPGLLRAIIAWGFIGAASPLPSERKTQATFYEDPITAPFKPLRSKVIPEQWAQGIAILRQLKDRGVDMTHTGIRREVKTRLWMLFGSGRSATKHTRLAQRLNKRSLAQYVKHINDVWRSNFFLLPRDRLASVSRGESGTYAAVFGRARRSRYHRDGVDGLNNMRRNRLRSNPDRQSQGEQMQMRSTTKEAGGLTGKPVSDKTVETDQVEYIRDSK